MSVPFRERLQTELMQSHCQDSERNEGREGQEEKWGSSLKQCFMDILGFSGPLVRACDTTLNVPFTAERESQGESERQGERDQQEVDEEMGEGARQEVEGPTGEVEEELGERRQ